ncbi:hypothetical protein EI94DRAFT_1836218, partial [Lactarius quietus]
NNRGGIQLPDPLNTPLTLVHSRVTSTPLAGALRSRPSSPSPLPLPLPENSGSTQIDVVPIPQDTLEESSVVVENFPPSRAETPELDTQRLSQFSTVESIHLTYDRFDSGGFGSPYLL